MPPKCGNCRRGWHDLCSAVWKWGNRKLGEFADGLEGVSRGTTSKELYQVECECLKEHRRGAVQHPLTSDFLEFEKAEAKGG